MTTLLDCNAQVFGKNKSMSLPYDVIHLFYNDRHIICDHQGLKMQYSRESEYIIHLKGHTCSLVLRTIMVRSGKDIPSVSIAVWSERSSLIRLTTKRALNKYDPGSLMTLMITIYVPFVICQLPIGQFSLFREKGIHLGY